MIVRLKAGADPGCVQRALAERGLWTERLEEPGQAALLRIHSYSMLVPPDSLLGVEGVAGVAAVRPPNPKVDAQPSVVDVAGVRIGAGAPPVLMAGPCGVESERQIRAVAARAAAAGATFLRGGAYKPRTSPYSFHGHGEAALRWLRSAADEFSLRVVTEVMAPEDAPRVARCADLMQIGSRSMQNFPLLRAAAATGKPILLKRGAAATLEEWLAAGEWCLAHGAPSVIFCERGIRGFDPSPRNLLDLGSVALLAGVLHQPVIVDPSHAAGRRDLIPALARAALAAGAAGLLIETHDDPGEACSDGPQALSAAELAALAASLPLSFPKRERQGAA